MEDKIKDFTWENIELNKKRKDEVIKDFNKKMFELKVFDKRLKDRLESIVRFGRRITGYPKGSIFEWEFSSDRVSYGSEVTKIAIYNSYNSKYDRTLKIPTKWLSTPDSIWMEELKEYISKEVLEEQKALEKAKFEERKKEDEFINLVLSSSDRVKEELKKRL